MTNPAPLIPQDSELFQAVSASHACKVKVAIVGDVHDLWDDAEESILRHLGVDLVLLVGDFGNEAVEVVQAVAQLNLPKAVILGNHDAWFTATAWGRGLRGARKGDRVQQQLDLLGAAHVGYGKLDFPQFGFSVVGSRPFSWGGSTWKNGSFYQQRFGIDGFAASTAKIVAAAAAAASETVIFIGHCGPKGLGDRPEDPCGKDWNPIGGDYGDPDFTDAIEQARALGKRIPLVAFGHMHHQLRHTKNHLRKMVQVDKDETVYLNAASVPRIVQTATGRSRNFSLVTLADGVVTEAALVWIQDDFTIQSQQILYQAAVPSGQG
jgi:uncharacterized protein (TIGR04168 family)